VRYRAELLFSTGGKGTARTEGKKEMKLTTIARIRIPILLALVLAEIVGLLHFYKTPSSFLLLLLPVMGAAFIAAIFWAEWIEAHGPYSAFRASRIAVLLAFVLPLHLHAQDMSKPVTERATNPLSISFETGRYEPEPGCKKEIDGCPEKVWTSTREFKLGSRIWVKVTVVNHSAQAAVLYETIGNDSFQVEVRESTTGAVPGLTQFGCAHSPSCREERNLRGKISGPFRYWVIPSGQSGFRICEVTREFEITDPGEYSVSVEAGAFKLTAIENIVRNGYIDKNAAKPAGELIADGVGFVVVK
jgi:hypothetical protein